jgi:hypothetical protein
MFVHLIRSAHYYDDDTRIVNFTMHMNPGEGVRSARLTQERPQHGVLLTFGRLGSGRLGRSIGIRDAPGFGPPRNVSKVVVDLDAIKARFPSATESYVKLITHHELGHAVGIKHHGDGNLKGPIVLLNTSGCPQGMTSGMVGGTQACAVSGVALRGRQNSGNATCPMKYLQWNWYVPPGWSLADRGPVTFWPGTFETPAARTLIAYESHQAPGGSGQGGPLRRYRKDLDTPPQPAYFCTASAGTGINALAGEQNHAGDSQHTPSCAAQLRVNDVPVGR